DRERARADAEQARGVTETGKVNDAALFEAFLYESVASVKARVTALYRTTYKLNQWVKTPASAVVPKEEAVGKEPALLQLGTITSSKKSGGAAEARPSTEEDLVQPYSHLLFYLEQLGECGLVRG
ncbi:unnamed protein product, partial [Amoebophrya sp. A25]